MVFTDHALKQVETRLPGGFASIPQLLRDGVRVGPDPKQNLQSSQEMDEMDAEWKRALQMREEFDEEARQSSEKLDGMAAAEAAIEADRIALQIEDSRPHRTEWNMIALEQVPIVEGGRPHRGAAMIVKHAYGEDHLVITFRPLNPDDIQLLGPLDVNPTVSIVGQVNQPTPPRRGNHRLGRNIIKATIVVLVISIILSFVFRSFNGVVLFGLLLLILGAPLGIADKLLAARNYDEMMKRREREHDEKVRKRLASSLDMQWRHVLWKQVEARFGGGPKEWRQEWRRWRDLIENPQPRWHDLIELLRSGR